MPEKMGFKSEQLPTEEMPKADGHRCRGFSGKASETGEASGVLYFRQWDRLDKYVH